MNRNLRLHQLPGLPSRSRPWLKVCGVCTVEEIEWCARWGATHVGVNAWPESPRFVIGERRAALISAARRAGLVSVLVAPGAGRLGGGRSGAVPDFIQMTAPPVERERAAMREGGIRIVETCRMEAGRTPELTWGDALLLDARVPGVAGGSGRSFDWDLAKGAPSPFVLAGGIGPANVARAVAVCRPSGVDAASGLESRPGVKDPAKIRDYCQAARAALEEIDHEF